MYDLFHVLTQQAGCQTSTRSVVQLSKGNREAAVSHAQLERAGRG